MEPNTKLTLNNCTAKNQLVLAKCTRKAIFCYVIAEVHLIMLPNPFRREHMSSHTIVIGGGVAGVGTALELANAGYQVTLLESLPTLLSGTSNRIPCRLGLGFHYVDSETALKNLEAALLFMKAYPNFRVAEKLPATHHLKRCRYYIVENSYFSQEQILATFGQLKNTYQLACDADPNLKVFGEPENFFKVLKPEEYSNIVAEEKIMLGIETAECLLNWPKFKIFLINQLMQHTKINIMLNTSATCIESNFRDGVFLYRVSCQQEDNTKIELESNFVVNCAWHNIEKLNMSLGSSASKQKRILRLKAMAKIKLPESLYNMHSALFCFGPHAGISNLGNGFAFLTYEPVTNMVTTDSVALPELLEKKLDKLQYTLNERAAIGQAIVDGAVQYIPELKFAEVVDVDFGIVRNQGDGNIYLKDSEIHRRRETGVEELAQGYIVNASMKLTYFVDNAKLVLKIIQSTEKKQKNLQQFMDKLNIHDSMLKSIPA